MKKKIYALTLFILVVSLIQASPSVLAATKNWGSSDGFWNNPNNWFPFGIPGIGDDVIVNPYGGMNTYLRFDSSTGSARSLVINSDTVNTIDFLQTGGSLTITTDQIVGSTGSGSYTLSGGSHTVGRLILGQEIGANARYILSAGSLSTGQLSVGGFGSNGSFTHSGGTNTVKGDLFVGGAIASRGQYSLSGGSLLATNVTIGGGADSISSFIQSSGTHTVKGNLTLGFVGGSEASYSLKAGDLFATGETLIGHLGRSIFVQSGGTNTVSDVLIVGSGTGDPEYVGYAIYYLNGGRLSAGSEVIGTGVGGVGIFDQSNGTSTVSGKLIIGENWGRGSYVLSGGSLSAGSEVIGTKGGTGTFVQSGGTHMVNGALILGDWDNLGGNGSYNLSAGSLSTDRLALGSFRSGGSFSQSGGTNTVRGDLSVGGVDSSGNYDLSGGSLLATNVTIGDYHGNGSFTQNGGTHAVKGNLTLGFFWGAGGGGYYSLNDGDLFATGETLISDWAGSIFAQKGGTNTVSDVLIVGTGTADPYYAGSATYYLSGGRLSAGSEVIGIGGGIGTFVQSNGTNAVSDRLTIGTHRSSGSYALSGGNLSVSEEFIGIGRSLEGNETIFTQSGGMHVVSNALIIGSGAGDPEDPYFAGSAKYYLSGGSLSAGSEIIGTKGGIGTFTQSGGTHTVNDTLILGEGWGSDNDNYAGSNGGYNLSAGSLSIGRLVLGDFRSSASFIQSGGINTVKGDLLVGGFESSGNYDLSGGSLLATNETIGDYHGYGSFTQSGGSHIVNAILAIGNNNGRGSYALSGGNLSAGNVIISSNSTFSQSGGTNTLSNQMTNNGIYSLSGGNLVINGGVDNSGKMSLIGGAATVNGNVINTASGEIEVAYSPALFTGDVINNGKFKTTHTTVTFAGTYTENGAYISDPSVNNFTHLIIGSSGYLVGGEGDEWRITGSFINHSLQNTLWKTGDADLFFDGSGIKDFYLASADYGLTPLGFNNNFAFGSLHLAAGAELNILDGNATPGAALYVELLVLGGGLSQLSDIHSDYNIYYDPYLPGNAYLQGNMYALDGGGILAPAIPEPEFYAMLLAGLGVLGFATRRREQLYRI